MYRKRPGRRAGPLAGPRQPRRAPTAAPGPTPAGRPATARSDTTDSDRTFIVFSIIRYTLLSELCGLSSLISYITLDFELNNVKLNVKDFSKYTFSQYELSIVSDRSPRARRDLTRAVRR